MSRAAHLPMPMTIEEIDCDWVNAALRVKSPDVTVRSMEVVDMIRGTSTKIRLRLDVDEAGRRAGIPETVIVKGGFEEHSAGMHYMYEREVRGYRDIWPELRLPCPVPYFADYDAEQRNGIIIMEDLVARGVTFCSPLEPQSQEEIARRIAMLARYHAQSWASAEFLPGGRWNWVEEHINALLIFIDDFVTPEFWKSYLALPRGAAFSTRFHDREWGGEAMKRLKAFCGRLPQSIIHGDTHLGNLYVDRDGTPGFYDSLVGRAPGMMEIAYHITCAADIADRPRWEGALVQHYLTELRRNDVSPPSFDEAMHQYGIFLAFGYYIFLINAPVFQTEAVNTAYAARFNAAMLDHDTYGLINAVSL